MNTVSSADSGGGVISRWWRGRAAKKSMLLAGVAAVVVYAIGDVLSGLLYDGYSYLDQAISELSAHAPAALTGRASKGVARLLRAHGFDLVAEPESFLVTKQDRLEPQETARAREWAATLAASLAPSPAQSARS